MFNFFKHQEQAIERAKDGNLALFHDCGTGKTLSGLTIANVHGGPTLIVCPLSIIDAAWIEDCKKFYPKMSIVSLWDKKPANRLKKLQQKHDIYVANYETFKSLFDHIQAKQFNVIIVDESSKMKSPESQLTRALLALAGIYRKKRKGISYPVKWVIPHRYVLSGTPAPNNQGEYWAQIKFLTGPGNDIFNDNFYVFRGEYFSSFELPDTKGQKIWKFWKEKRQAFADAMRGVCHVVKTEDAIDLPDQVVSKRVVRLSAKEQSAYNKMRDEFALMFGDEVVLGRNALAKVMKLRQITSGFVYGDEGCYRLGKSKLNELLGMLEEIGSEQVIIWANFKEEIETLLKALPGSVAIWGGAHDRIQAIADFKNLKTQYLICHPAAAAHGLTLTNCRFSIYYSMDYSFEYHHQSMKRTHRHGQTRTCVYYYLLADKTIDQIVYKAVINKADLSKETLDHLKGGRHATKQQIA